MARAGEPHPALRLTLDRLGASSVRWCLLRGESELHRADRDVDLLVHPIDLRAARAVLGSTGFGELRAWGRWPHHFFVAASAGEPARLKLDVVTQLAFGPQATLRTDAAAAVLARRVPAAPAPRPAPADAFWALLLHALLDRGAVRPSHARELEALAPRARDERCPLWPFVEAASPPGWNAALLVDAVEGGCVEKLLGIAPELRARWPGTPPVAGVARAWLRGGLRFASRRLPPRPRARAQHRGAMTSNSAASSTG